MKKCRFCLSIPYGRVRLVSTSEEDSACRRLAGVHTDTGGSITIEWDTTYGGFGLVLDRFFGLRRAVPMGEDEASELKLFFELFVSLRHKCVSNDSRVPS